MDLSRFTVLLEKAFLEFRIRQTRQRLSVSLNSFAKFLDFSPPIVNLWLNGGRLPTQGNVERIIPKLVDLLDLEVYDFLELPRPDPDLQLLIRIWDRIPKEKRQELANLAERYLTEKDSESEKNLPQKELGSALEPQTESSQLIIETAKPSDKDKIANSEPGIVTSKA